nr:DUF3460 family protein [Pseudomonas sp.]
MATSYQSDLTQFLNKLKQENPRLETEQLKGRAEFWERDVDHDLQEEFEQARIPQKPYVYFNE